MPIPSDGSLDASLALLLEGNTFISKRSSRLRSDVFQTRLLFENTICLYGQDAAELFYDPERFVRAGAAPARLQKTLFGSGGVQGLDGAAHRHRKALHMSLMSPAEVKRLADLSTEQWQVYADRWTQMERVVLFDEVMELLCRAVCDWAGVPLMAARHRTAQLAALIDAPGAVGFRYLKGRLSRVQTEAWAAELIRGVRVGKLAPPPGSALSKLATFRERGGALLPVHNAAVELLNVLRPTVAVARFIVFAALALHDYPSCRARVQEGDEKYLELFVQEVRRFYPFFPFTAARVRTAFNWRGFYFPQGWRVLLGLYATNHDARIWGEPEAFIPERFYQWDGSPYTFIPQGGGEHYTGHRCAGEWLTVSLMKVAVAFLSRSLRYTVPKQDLGVDLRRMPAIPRSRFVITNVQRP